MLAVTVNDIYLARNREIILFEDQNDINFFLQKFFNYAMQKAATGLGDVFEVMTAQNNVKVEEFDMNNLRYKNCKTCLWSDIKREKGL